MGGVRNWVADSGGIGAVSRDRDPPDIAVAFRRREAIEKRETAYVSRGDAFWSGGISAVVFAPGGSDRVGDRAAENGLDRTSARRDLFLRECLYNAGARGSGYRYQMEKHPARL